MVDFVRDWSTKTELPAERFVGWLGVARGKFFDWRRRYGKANEHNALVPRDHWLDASEKRAIIEFHGRNPLEGYRRLTFMMLDADVVAASPASVYPSAFVRGPARSMESRALEKGHRLRAATAPS